MKSETQPTVFVVDDDDSMRKALSYLLLSAGLRVETYSSAEEFMTRDQYNGVGCIILDVNMPGLSGMGLQEKLIQAAHSMPIIFLTGHGELTMGVQAMKRGAVDFLTKPCDDDQLLGAVHSAIEKAQETRSRLEETREIRIRMELLTPRENEILGYVIAGMLNKQIAGRLGIAEVTVKMHRGRIMEKLGAGSVADLVRLAEKVGIKPPDRA
jgi:two-component system, LuxR family, response regulator FixJ